MVRTCPACGWIGEGCTDAMELEGPTIWRCPRIKCRKPGCVEIPQALSDAWQVQKRVEARLTALDELFAAAGTTLHLGLLANELRNILHPEEKTNE